MADRLEVANTLAGLALFSDLTGPELQSVSHSLDEAWFPAGERILRQGLSGSAFYVIIDGEARVIVDGQERARLLRGDYFGEVSVLLGEPPSADVVASTPLRCLVLPGPDVESFLVSHPRVAFRMLQAQSRRLRDANRWRS